MKKFSTIKAMLAALLQLPAVTALIPAERATRKLFTEALDRGLEDSINRWYEARASAQLGVSKDNGYPGHLAAFQLALKSGYFAYRYIFPAAGLNEALEAIQKNLPSVEEIDSYPDNSGPKYLEKQVAAFREVQQRLAQGGESTEICDCPNCQLRRQLIPSDPDSEPETQRQVITINRGADENEVLGAITAQIEKLMAGGKLKQASYDEVRQELVELGVELRGYFAAGDTEYVRQFTSSAPNIATIQATITRLSELGFTDVTEPWIKLIIEDDPTFVLTPPPGTKEYLKYLQVLRTYYPSKKETESYPGDAEHARRFRRLVLDDSIREAKRLLATSGAGGEEFLGAVKVLSEEPRMFRSLLAKLGQMGELPLAQTLLNAYWRLTGSTGLRFDLAPSDPGYDELQADVANFFG